MGATRNDDQESTFSDSDCESGKEDVEHMRNRKNKATMKWRGLVKETKVDCGICGKTISNRKNLKQHEKTHLGEYKSIEFKLKFF